MAHSDSTPASNQASTSPTGDAWLLTPGPLTTSPQVKQAMLHDYGSRDHHFIAVNKRMRTRIVDIIHGGDEFVTVPMQGSGTFVVEAMIGTFVPPGGKALVLINGAYGKRIAKICDYCGRAAAILEWPENEPVDPEAVDKALNDDGEITHVIVVMCETTTGILNPVKAVADVVARHGRSLLIDAMSAFGAIELDSRDVTFDAVVASSNKCLEGTPGLGFCVARKSALSATKGNCHSLSLDLHDQWDTLERTSQYRFTPPVQTIIGFDRALDEFEAEGGVAGRGGRYTDNCQVLVEGMKQLGFQSLLPAELQAPIIVTFLMPSHPNFHFEKFYDALRTKGFIIYPGKLTVAETFRIGCIGYLYRPQIEGALAAIAETLVEMEVRDGTPVAA